MLCHWPSMNGSSREPLSPRRLRAAGGSRLRFWVVNLTAMSCFFLSGLRSAHAEEELGTPSPGGVSVILQGGEPGLTIGIRLRGDASLAKACPESCRLTLAPGTYRVTVSRAGESWSRSIWIDQSQRLILTPPDEGSRDLGTALAISGGVIGGVGSILFVYGAMRVMPCAFEGDEGDRNGSCPGPTLLLVGLGGMATGVALGIPALVLLIKSGRPSVDFQLYSEERAQAAGFYVGFGSARALAGLSLGARF
jgi:hypothetical protein